MQADKDPVHGARPHSGREQQEVRRSCVRLSAWGEEVARLAAPCGGAVQAPILDTCLGSRRVAALLLGVEKDGLLCDCYVIAM